MPIMRRWHDPEETILIQEFTAPWNWKQFHDNLNEVKALLAARGKRPICFVHHLTAIAEGNESALSHLRKSFEILQDNVQLNIAVFAISTPAMNRFASILFQTGLRVFKVDPRTQMLPTLELALQRIQAHQSTQVAAAPK